MWAYRIDTDKTQIYRTQMSVRNNISFLMHWLICFVSLFQTARIFSEHEICMTVVDCFICPRYPAVFSKCVLLNVLLFDISLITKPLTVNRVCSLKVCHLNRSDGNCQSNIKRHLKLDKVKGKGKSVRFIVCILMTQ